MDYFNYHNDVLCAEQVPLTELAERWGTPTYVYSRATLERHWHAFDKALGDHPHLIAYSVKANSNLAVLNVLAKLGSGFDVVSLGELVRVERAGGDPNRCVFSGVAKQDHEIEYALKAGIHCLNVESSAELIRVNRIAEHLGLSAPIALRINPDIDPKTHPYIATGLQDSKFGIDITEAKTLYQQAAALPHLRIIGMDCHIGSQLTELNPFLEALDRLLVLMDELSETGIHFEHLDIGGGLGVRYQEETPPQPSDYAEAVVKRLHGRPLTLVLEPGRAIAANSGILLTRIIDLKPGAKNFALVDAAMNDLLRPTLYQAWHTILPVVPNPQNTTAHYDIVGPICESGDFIGKDRELAIAPNELLAIRSAGAYGFVMSSQYNSRPRAAEIMVDGHQHTCVRRRETLDDLFSHETLLP